MPRVIFAPVLQRHVECSPADVPGGSVRAVLDAAFATNPRARSYVLDDQSALRKHMLIFVDGVRINDRVRLTDAVGPDSQIYVMQSLSGG
ncbi:MAG: MoaD/ThiS family protein [Hyphomicrobium sp.]